MSRQDLFESILTSFNSAMLDDALWPAAAGLIDEFCGAKGNFLIFGDGATQDDVDIFFARFCFGGQRREDLERLYFGTYHAVDERLPRLRLLPDSRLAPVRSLFTEEEMKTSALYNEGLEISDTSDSLNVRLDGPEGSRIVWVVADPVAGDGWSSDQVESIQRILPHIRQFVRFRQTLADAGALRVSLTGLLDSVRTGVVQLDRRGRVRAANDRARDILGKRDGLADQRGLLRAVLPAEDEKLQGLLAQALPFGGGPIAGGSMLVSGAEGQPRMVVHVCPVNEEGPDPRQSRVGVLVLVVDPANRNGIDADRVAAMLGLTAAESQVAVLLAQGKTIREIAAETGRSRTTIKWHMRQIFAKHGISRQLELVQLVTALGEVPGPRR